jgi:hypothetical protein
MKLMKQPGSMRSGHLNLRGQGLRPALLDVLKKEELGIELSVSDEKINTTDFIELTTRVNNHLGQSPIPCERPGD